MHRVDSVRGLPINPRARAVLRQQTDRLSALPAPVTRAPTLTGHFKVGGGGAGMSGSPPGDDERVDGGGGSFVSTVYTVCVNATS